MIRSRILPLFILTCALLAGGVSARPASGAARGRKGTAARQKSDAARKQNARPAAGGELLPAAQAGLERRNNIKARVKKFNDRKRRAQAAGAPAAGGDPNVRFDKPGEAIEWYLKKRLPKGEKNLPVERYFEAREKIKKMRRHSTAKNKDLPSQDEAGDAEPDLSAGEGEFPNSTGGGGAGDGSASTSGALGTWTALGPGNIGGRTRALLVDPNNPDVMYAAAVAGGIWKTTNAGASWTPLNDFLANIAVTTLVFDPSDSKVIYAGTGEGFFNADAVRGAGIFKTTDAGATWTRLAATVNNASFFFVNDIAVSPAHPQHVYAATRAGVMRSLDGGNSWALALASNNATGIRGAMDLVMRTDAVGQASDYIFVAMGSSFAVAGEVQSRIFRNTDAGGAGAWTEVYTEPNMARTSLALAPSNQNIIYALSASRENGIMNTALLGVFRSDSSGDPGTWTARVRNTSPTKLNRTLLSNPVNAFNSNCGSGADAWINQGWYDNVIAVDPVNPEVVWAGGTDLFRSDDGGANWGLASYWWFTGNGTHPTADHPQYAHADQHIIVFHPHYDGASNQTLFAGNDGGIYRTNNSRSNVSTTTAAVCGFAFAAGANTTVASPITWQSVNNGYAVTQFYHGLPYPGGATYFGGTQDNGTNRGTDAAGQNAWARIFGGDGGYVAVDPTNTNILYAETTGLSIRKSTNGGASFALRTTGITTTGATGDVFPFITTFTMDPSNPNRLWIGGRGLWRTDNGATSWVRASGNGLVAGSAVITGGSISAIAVAPTNQNLVLAGTASGRVARTTVGTTANNTTLWTFHDTPRGLNNGTISWITFDPTNANVAYLTISTFNTAPSGAGAGHVFKSSNGGQTWTNIDGTGANAIPDIPAHNIVVDPNNGQRLYVGTDLGVFVSLDGGLNWARETSGFANVPVESMTAMTVGGVTNIFAFTHGRGAFKVVVPASCANVTPTNQAFFSPGAAGTVSVTKSAAATGACDWHAVSNSDFITVDSGTSGTGTGSVAFTVAPNTTGAARTGTLTVAGQQINITQDAAPVAANDAATTDEDTPVQIDVRANDSDPDGDATTVTSVTQGASGAVAITGGGAGVSYSPAPNFFGADSFTYTIGDGHGGAATATVSVTINPVNDAPVFSISTAAQSVQYSDAVAPVSVSVSDVDDATATLTLSVVSALPAGLTSTPGAAGSLTISGNPTAAAGTYPVQLKAVDPQNAVTNATVTFTVTKETAETFYTGDTSVVTAGPSVAAATFRLGAHLTEQPDGAAGDITLARVTFELFKSNNMTDTADRTVSGVPVNAAGDALALIDNVGADTYVVKVKVDAGNGYWTASPVGMDIVNVTVGTNDQRANGGGWVGDPASANGKSNFGFTVRNEKGTPKGNFVFVTRGADGFNYVVKNNAWQGGFLNFAGEAGTSALTRATFRGRCNVQKVDPATGLTVQSWGGFNFTVDVRDGDLLTPRQGDSFALLIQDGAGGVWRQLGAPAAMLPLGGGNVQVKGK